VTVGQLNDVAPGADELMVSLRSRLCVQPVRTVPISVLLLSESPRLAGVDEAHAQALATAGSVLPRIIVHSPTMRVIDGAHRVRAAVLRGQDTIEACLVDGTDGEAFLLAVHVNTNHGLPLSLADRKAAASRIVRDYPQWSNRVVAVIAGISDKTVGAQRANSVGMVVCARSTRKPPVGASPSCSKTVRVPR
jgi:hypothetical protein